MCLSVDLVVTASERWPFVSVHCCCCCCWWWTLLQRCCRLFPLTYAQFQRYAIDVQDTGSYMIKPEQVNYKPTNEDIRDRWFRYNADVKVDMARLQPMLDQALGV